MRRIFSVLFFCTRSVFARKIATHGRILCCALLQLTNTGLSKTGTFYERKSREKRLRQTLAPFGNTAFAAIIGD